MDFWDLTKLLFRRWYIAVPLFLVTLGAAAWTSIAVNPDYKATSYVQLIPPSAPTTKDAVLHNPWVDLGLGSLNTAATYATIDKTFLDRLEKQGLSDNVTITTGYPAPIATIEVIANSQSKATATMAEVVKQFDQAVKTLQDGYGVQPNGMILTRRLDTGQNLAETGGKVKRALIAVAGAGMLATAGVTIGIDALLRRRTRRRAQQATTGGGEASGAPAAPSATGVVIRQRVRTAESAGTTYSAQADRQNGQESSEATRRIGLPDDPHTGMPPGADVTVILPRSIDLPAVDGGSKQR